MIVGYDAHQRAFMGFCSRRPTLSPRSPNASRFLLAWASRLTIL
jgi:hypothetical protein